MDLGRDGLTHNMLELIHSHWKGQRVCKVRCKGVPTVDMNNVCRHLEVITYLYHSLIFLIFHFTSLLALIKTYFTRKAIEREFRSRRKRIS